MTAPAPVGRPHHRWDHLPHATGMQRFNRALAIKVTGAVGTVWCAYIFAVIALIGLPAAIQQATSGGFHPLPVVQWVAQTFLQLVLLSVIIVGQNVSGEASDARAVKTYNDTEQILDRLDVSTQHGLADVMAELGHMRDDLRALSRGGTGT